MRTKQIKDEKFDAVKYMREIRDKISTDIQNMNFEELKKYFEIRRIKLSQ